MPAAATSAARSDSGARTVRSVGRLASATHTASVWPGMPSAINRAVIAARWRVPMRTTRVMPDRATVVQSTPHIGSSGDLLPETTVKPREPPSAVSGNAASPGTATALVTPGTTSTGTPASTQA